MKLLLSWLNDYVKVDDIPVQELSNSLVGIGFEVEEIINISEDIEGIYTGKITSIERHPNAEKLSVCSVDFGNDCSVIVTGANNINVGDIVPVARDGATVKGGKKIVSSPLRGVMSFGMMCSGEELGVDDDIVANGSVDGILILDKNTPIGSDIRDILGLNDYIFDVSITANRPDCQSVYGLAREISALYNRKLQPLKLDYKTVTKKSDVKVEIHDAKRCSRYCLREIINTKVDKSPIWLRRRLKLVGHNSINNIVDITNYVLVEVGQPLHAFDKMHIKDKIVVRTAKDGEKINALDKSEYRLSSNMLVISDVEKPLAIAGVMGGEHSGICNDTANVLLETARFSRGTVRTTSRQLALRSDSSARYEKGVDWQSVDTGRERALSLFDELSIGQILSGGSEDGCDAPQKNIIKTSIEQINSLLGIKIEKKNIIAILNKLGIETQEKSGDLTCTIPLFREDIENFTDLAEEVIRFYGYDNIVSTVFNTTEAIRATQSVNQQRMNEIRQFMVGNGALEVVTYSFINPVKLDDLLLKKDDKLRNAIRILNPLSEEYSIMRTQSVSSMLDIVHVNSSKKNENYRLFELAKVYTPHSIPLNELPCEQEILTIAFNKTNEDFYSVKSVISDLMSKFKVDYSIDFSKASWLHTGISADIICDNSIIGNFGKIHPLVAKNFSVPESIYIAQINVDGLLKQYSQNIKFVPLPKFPSVERDLAFTVKTEHSIGNMIKTIKQAAGNLCEDVELFDIYEGEQIQQGFKSVAFAIKLRAHDKTLTEQDIQGVVLNIIDKVCIEFDAKLRE